MWPPLPPFLRFGGMSNLGGVFRKSGHVFAFLFLACMLVDLLARLSQVPDREKVPPSAQRGSACNWQGSSATELVCRRCAML